VRGDVRHAQSALAHGEGGRQQGADVGEVGHTMQTRPRGGEVRVAARSKPRKRTQAGGYVLTVRQVVRRGTDADLLRRASYG